MDFPGIYAIISKNGKWYIGSTSRTIEKRIKQHFSTLKKQKHGNRELQKAFNKHGEEYFSYAVIEAIRVVESKAALLEREQYYLDTIGACTPLYNECPIAGSRLGSKSDPDTRAKISASLKGIKRGPMPESQKLRLSKAKKGRPGHAVSKETREKISHALRGRKLSDSVVEFLRNRPISDEQRRKSSETQRIRFSNPEERAKVARQRTGTKMSPEGVANLSAAKKNPSEETRRRISEGNRRRYQSEAERKKTADASRGRVKSEEERRKISEAKKEYWRKRREASA